MRPHADRLARLLVIGLCNAAIAEPSDPPGPEADQSDFERVAHSAEGSADPGERWCTLGRIAFYSNRDGNYEIYSVQPGSADARRLTTNDADDQCPAWSPDGTRIAFTSDRTGDGDIYTMDADGADLRRITSAPGPERHPAFSPDGSQLAYSAERDGNWDIYVQDVATGAVRRATTSPAWEGFPQWSPDGTKMLMTVRDDQRHSIAVMDVDGANRRVVAQSDTLDMVFGRWSPDGGRIAYFAFDAHTHAASIHTMLADGTGDVRLTDGSGRDEDPAWSPDGREIVFHALHRDGTWDIYSIDVESRAVRRVVDNPASEYWPHWGPPAPAHGDGAGAVGP